MIAAVAESTKANSIRVLNDNFRSTLIGGQVVMTQGVNDLTLAQVTVDDALVP